MNPIHQIILIGVLLLSGCATMPPSNPANLCAIFSEKDDWYAAAKTASGRWAVPIPITMAIINQESSFVDDARPARVRFLGIPLWRPSSAFGYGQAKDETWEWYTAKTGNGGAARDEFADAVDFVAWYVHQSHRMLGIARHDAYNQYLAYHEGQGGYRQGRWREKRWLRAVALKVEATAKRYQHQLDGCAARLERYRAG
jgi:hypothetical protein